MYDATGEDYAARLWCMRNGIFVFREARPGNKTFDIVIRISGRESRDPAVYTEDIVEQRMFEYFKYYYRKREKEQKSTL